MVVVVGDVRGELSAMPLLCLSLHLKRDSIQYLGLNVKEEMRSFISMTLSLCKSKGMRPGPCQSSFIEYVKQPLCINPSPVRVAAVRQETWASRTQLGLHTDE